MKHIKFLALPLIILGVCIYLDSVLGTSGFQLAFIGSILGGIFGKEPDLSYYDDALDTLKRNKQNTAAEIDAQKGEDATTVALRTEAQKQAEEDRAHDEGVANVIGGTPALAAANNRSRLDKLAQTERTIASMRAAKDQSLAQQKLSANMQADQNIANMEFQKGKAQSDAEAAKQQAFWNGLDQMSNSALSFIPV